MNYVKLSILALLATSSLMRADYTDMQRCKVAGKKIEDCIETHCGGNNKVAIFNTCMDKVTNRKACLDKCEKDYNQCFNFKVAADISPADRCNSQYGSCMQLCSYDHGDDSISSCEKKACE